MGTTVNETPGELNFRVTRGEVGSRLVDFSIDLTGYTFSAEIVSAVTFSTVATLDVTAVNLASGQINVGIGPVAASEVASGTYLWRLVWTPWGGDPRTALEGIWEVTR